MRSIQRAILELAVLATIAWGISVLIRPHPEGVNVAMFSLKWFVYTYLMATGVYVVIPFAALFAIGALVALLSRRREFWLVYRIAFVGAAIWVALGNYGSWYGSCRTEHSVSYCHGDTRGE